MFLSTIALHPEKVRKICLGILTLHNWLRSSICYISPNLPDRINPSTQEIIPGAWRQQEEGHPNQLLPLEPSRYAKNPTIRAKQIRDEFKEYFNHQGAVPWQWNLCMDNWLVWVSFFAKISRRKFLFLLFLGTDQNLFGTQSVFYVSYGPLFTSK